MTDSLPQLRAPSLESGSAGNVRADADVLRWRGRRLLVICPYPQGVAASQRLKFEQYLDDWRQAGFNVTVAPFMDMRMWHVLYEPGHLARKAAGVVRGYLRRLRDLIRIRHADLVYVHMWVTPFGSTLFERLARKLARKVVFDVEDNVLLVEKPGDAVNPNPILKWLKGPGKPRYLIRTADHVVTSSPFLNETCRDINLRGACTYITSSVDTERFLPADRHHTFGPVTVGWTGTFSTRPYLDLLRPVFAELARRIPFRLKVIGNFEYNMPGVDLEVVRWSAEREVADLQTIDIGVYPLPVDDWVMGKSGLKAIQYMAFGLPTVATSVGNTPRLIRDGENGLLVRTPSEWVDALERLIRNPDLRRRLGKAARADAEKLFSLRAVASQYRGVLADAMESKR